MAAVMSRRRPEVERGPWPDGAEGRSEGYTVVCRLLELARSLQAYAAAAAVDDDDGDLKLMRLKTRYVAS